MATFRELLARDEPVLAPGAYDGLSARLVERAGFPALRRDGRARAAARAGSGGIADADADAGYGNPLNVMRTVREYEAAGFAALHIEDQVAPKRCGHMDGEDVIDASEMAESAQSS